MCDIKKNPIFTRFKESLDGPIDEEEEERKNKKPISIHDRLEKLKD